MADTEDEAVTALRRVPGVEAVYVVADDATAASSGSDAISEAQGALLAALVGALRQTTDDLGLGELGELLVEAGNGGIMAGALPSGMAAVVITGPRANLGMVRVELRRLRRGL